MELKYYLKIMVDDNDNVVISKFLSYLDKKLIEIDDKYTAISFNISKQEYINSDFDKYLQLALSCNEARKNNINECGIQCITKKIKTEVF